MPLRGSEAATVLTRGLAWTGLALVVFILLARLRTLTILTATQRGLREASIVRVRTSRLAAEGVVLVVVLSWWAAGVVTRGSFEWEVGGSGSPLHVDLAGIWFAVGGGALAVATALVLAFSAKLAFARALGLREDFPRSVGQQPQALRVALMNPGVVFIARRRSPLMWIWTEIRAATFGVATTLAVEAVADAIPITRGQLDDTIDEADEDFELTERLAGHRGALTWNELPTLLSAMTGIAPVHNDPLILPPANVPLNARSVGFWLGILNGVMRDRRRTERMDSLGRFDEHGSIKTILDNTAGPIAVVYRTSGADPLLYEVRGRVLDDLKPQLSYRYRRQLAKAFREDGMEGAAAWMIESVPGYPAMFQETARAELDRMTGVIDSVMAQIEEPQNP